MSKKLAIRGHSTRGNEVVELIGMLCGQHPYTDNICTAKCNIKTDCYYMCDYGFISWSYLGPDEIDNFKVFTLEEFLEKYPFKIGNRVLIPEYESEVRICKMRWDPLCEYVEYMVYRNDDPEWYTAEELLNWNDTPDNTSKNMEEKKINQMSLANCDLDEVEIVLGDRFELKTKDGKYYAVRKKSKYPTTYKECCDVLLIPPYYNLRYHTYERGYNEYATSNELLALQDKLNTLGKLIICRNAYWKIAGEEMGLGKPWKPNEDSIIAQYGIRPLLFPSKEIYNMFYDNFKDLIEQCKELL